MGFEASFFAFINPWTKSEYQGFKKPWLENVLFQY